MAGAGTAPTAVGGVNADLAGLDATALSNVVEECGRAAARAHGRQLRAIAALDEQWAGTPQADFVDAEVALAMHVSDGYASFLLQLSRALTRRLPGTFTALEVGDIDLHKARAIDEYTAELDEAAATAVETAVLGKASEQTLTELKRALNREIHKADPDGARNRREQAEKQRKVASSPEPDGMASIYAYLSAEGAAIVMLVLDSLARAARSEPGETRTLDELRADILVAIFRAILETGGYNASPTQTRRGRKPHLQVTIDALTLLGLADNPGHLAGYGPIPAHVARTLAQDATWTRIITDPVTGELLDHGTTRYRPGKVLDDHVTNRDQTCRWPGCTRPAVGCQLDHTIPYPHGPTAHWNLGPYCLHHHRAKHAGYTVEQPTPGTFVLRTPTGRVITVRPADLAPPNPAALAAAERAAARQFDPGWDPVPDQIRQAWNDRDAADQPPDDPGDWLDDGMVA